LKDQFNPSPEQEEFIEERLEYLSEAVDKLNRFDWKGVALSTLLSIGANLCVDKESGRILFGLFQQAFQSVTHLLK
jgi:hypothetical protein